MRVLGIDPGSAATGWGLVERVGGAVRHVDHGTLRPRRADGLAPRLAALLAGLGGVLERHRPDVVVVERVFVAASARSALVLGQARGVALARVGSAGLPVREYAASEIKQAVTGSGAATKAEVQAMVARLLDLAAPPPRDAADALAAALCHAHAGRLGELAAGLASRGTRAGRGRRRGRGGAGLVVRRVR